MKNVLFFTLGDSNSASTWSNVPYCFSKELERRGITVYRVNMEPSKLLSRIWNRSLYSLSKIIWPKNAYSFGRTHIASSIVWRKIKKAVHSYPQSDLCIFIGFDFYNKFSNIPSLLFCDWTFKILIERSGRKPYFFERSYCHREESVINAADYVVSLFPDCASRMKLECPKANIYSFDTNVINILYDRPLLEHDVIAKKGKRMNIVFVGNQGYKDSLMLLLRSFQSVQSVLSDVELHIIGMTSENTGVNGHNIHYYGYLRKDVETERELYYNTLISASVIVNVSPNWGGYSSVIEAMYFYTPVIVAPYQEFVAEFGEDISFGYYNRSFTEECLERNLVSLLQSNHYEAMCREAHERVKNYTWAEYVNKIEELVR